jgi:hypothetical protein
LTLPIGSPSTESARTRELPSRAKAIPLGSVPWKITVGFGRGVGKMSRANLRDQRLPAVRPDLHDAPACIGCRSRPQ